MPTHAELLEREFAIILLTQPKEPYLFQPQLEHKTIPERQTEGDNLAIKGIAINEEQDRFIYLCFQSFDNRLL